MILEIDTIAKAIKIKGSCTLEDLFKTLHQMFPEDEFIKDWVVTEYPIYDWGTRYPCSQPKLPIPGTWYTGTCIPHGTICTTESTDYGIKPQISDQQAIELGKLQALK